MEEQEGQSVEDDIDQLSQNLTGCIKKASSETLTFKKPFCFESNKKIYI